MKKLFVCRLHGDNNELTPEFQDALNTLNKEGMRFNIEEYYDDVLTVYVSKSGFYLYSTKQIAKKPNSQALIQFECTLSKAESLEKLYVALRSKRTYLELHEVKVIINNIEAFARKISLI